VNSTAFAISRAHQTRSPRLRYGIWYHLGIVNYGPRGNFSSAAATALRSAAIAPESGELAGYTELAVDVSLSRAEAAVRSEMAMLDRKPESRYRPLDTHIRVAEALSRRDQPMPS